MRRVCALLLVLAVGLTTGCGTDDPQAQSADVSVGEDGGAPEDYSFDEIHGAAEHMHVWALLIATGIDEAAAAEGPVQGRDEQSSSPAEAPDIGGKVHTKAVALLGELDFLLREWSTLLNFAGHETIVDDPDAFAAARQQLDETNEDLRRKIAELYDLDAADDFAAHWEAFTQALLNIAQAVGADDESAELQAHEEAQKAIEQLADWAEDVTSGEIRPDELIHELELEETKLTEAFEAIADTPHEWYPNFRDAVEHTKKIAELLAAGFAMDLRLEGDVHSEAAKLVAELAGAMEDYAFFASAATRAKVATGRAEDVRAAEEITEEATAAIAEVIEKRLGTAPAVRFHELWLEHTPWFLDLAATYGQDVVPPPDEIRAQLADWSKQLGQLLEEITSGKLSAESMEKEAATHVDTMIAVIEAQATVLGNATS